MELLLPSLHNVAAKHGHGLLHAVLDGLCRAHAINLEVTAHGVFHKAHFPKSSTTPRTSPMRSTPSPSTALSTCSSPGSVAKICRSDLLLCKLPATPKDFPIKNSFIHFAAMDSQPRSGCYSAPASEALDVSATLPPGLPAQQGFEGADVFSMDTPRPHNQNDMGDLLPQASRIAAIRIQSCFRGWKGRQSALDVKKAKQFDENMKFMSYMQSKLDKLDRFEASVEALTAMYAAGKSITSSCSDDKG